MVFAGGLQVIPSRVLLDVLAWTGLSYSIWAPPHWKNTAALLATVWVTLATAGATSRWTVTFPLAPLCALQLFRRFGSKLRNSKLLYYLSLFLVLMSVALSALFPPLQIPKAQAGGPYAVGAVDFFLPIETDSAESCSIFNHTQVRARLLYPTNSTAARTIPYLTPTLALEFLQESMKAAAPPELKPYDWLMHHWLLTELPIERHASLLPSSERDKFPLVVYSHGLMGSADLYSYQAMSLASQGLLVLLINHLDGSAPIAEHHDGSRVTFDYDIIQLWHDGKKEEYVRERRSRTEWRALELLGATDTFLSLNDNHEETPSFWKKEAPNLSLHGRIQTERIFLMGHSFGGATALQAAFRRPELVEGGGGVIAHEPAIDWLPDDTRRSLFPKERLEGLESSHDFTGGTGGLEYHTTTSLNEGEAVPESSIHELNLLLLFSEQWRLLAWGESHILEEMHQKGRLGPAGGLSDFAVIQEAYHNEFSDMCMLTPLWLARGTGVTGTRNPLETAQEIEERTWKFVSSILEEKPRGEGKDTVTE